jgi:hypothetical protein
MTFKDFIKNNIDYQKAFKERNNIKKIFRRYNDYSKNLAILLSITFFNLILSLIIINFFNITSSSEEVSLMFISSVSILFTTFFLSNKFSNRKRSNIENINPLVLKFDNNINFFSRKNEKINKIFNDNHSKKDSDNIILIDRYLEKIQYYRCIKHHKLFPEKHKKSKQEENKSLKNLYEKITFTEIFIFKLKKTKIENIQSLNQDNLKMIVSKFDSESQKIISNIIKEKIMEKETNNLAVFDELNTVNVNIMKNKLIKQI